jgi:CDP-diglyceride synthetase
VDHDGRAGLGLSAPRDRGERAACLELARMFERTGRPISTWLTVGVGGALTASFATSLYGGTTWRTARAVDADAGSRAPPRRRAHLQRALVDLGQPQVESTANTLFGAIYVGLLLGYAIWLHGASAVRSSCCSWWGDVVRRVGRVPRRSSVGRHRLAPILSPRKTVEGAAAQVIVSVAAALALERLALARVQPDGRRGVQESSSA